MVHEAVLFDLDGTLVHTKPEYRYIIMGNVLATFRVPYNARLIDRLWFDAEKDKIISDELKLDPEIFWRLYFQYETMDFRRRYTEPYSDADFVNQLKVSGYKTGVVSAAPLHVIELEVEMLGRENFDTVVRAQPTSGIRPKPEPDGIVECLRILGVQNNKTVYVGNGPEDVIAAQKAGVLDVLIKRGEYDFQDTNPSVRINSLYELRGVLD